jgi:hypothetical protein
MRPRPAPITGAKTGPAPGWAALRSAGVMVSGSSRAVKRAHAADQPSWVSGHHSSGCDRGVCAVQIPK